MNPIEVPVLVLGFNRPNLTRSLIQCLSEVRPNRIYFAVDGPRTGNIQDVQLVAEVKSIALEIDWPCEIHTLFREQNLGLKNAVIEAIDWIFQSEEQAIILEDDCHPRADFFEFCAESLKRYEYDERVMQISGNCFVPISDQNCHRYYFSTINDIWGWATWKRAWMRFERDIPDLDSIELEGKLSRYFNNKQICSWFKRYIREAGSNDSQVWSTQWTLTLINNMGLTIVPQTNLVENVGFTTDATHYTDGAFAKYQKFRAQGIQSKTHPTEVILNRKLDDERFKLIKKTDLNLRRSNLVRERTRIVVFRILPKSLVVRLRLFKNSLRGG
jgi:hypothetical protein